MNSWQAKSAKYARICPQHTRFLYDSHSGQGKCDLALAIIDGKMKWGDDPEIKDILFQCTMCGGCDAMAKNIRDAELVNMYRWMRAEYIKEMGPLPEHKPMLDSLKQYDNVWLQPRMERNRNGGEVYLFSRNDAHIPYLRYFLINLFSLRAFWGLTLPSSHNNRSVLTPFIELYSWCKT